MSMVKRFLEEYCEAKHPDDYDAQDALFEAICDGTIQPSIEEMQAVIHEQSQTQGDAGVSVRSDNARVAEPATD